MPKKNPVLVGFGIKTPTDAQRIAQHADGVIVGRARLFRNAQEKRRNRLAISHGS